jgi:thioredoxin-related protein
MKSFISLLAATFLSLALAGHAQAGAGSGYDPSADAAAALARATVEAKASNKQVLVIAGGDWCRWCLILNTFLSKNPDVQAELDRSFVTTKAYIGDENANAEFFAKLPKAKGYPHFWVISPSGKAIQSINTGMLENGKDSYDKAAFLRFIRAAAKR